MKRTELYDLAVAVARGALTENNPIELTTGIVKAAKDNNVDPADFAEFQNYCKNSRAIYQGLARMPLPSENAAKRAQRIPVAPAAAPAPATTHVPASAPAESADNAS